MFPPFLQTNLHKTYHWNQKPPHTPYTTSLVLSLQLKFLMKIDLHILCCKFIHFLSHACNQKIFLLHYFHLKMGISSSSTNFNFIQLCSSPIFLSSWVSTDVMTSSISSLLYFLLIGVPSSYKKNDKPI